MWVYWGHFTPLGICKAWNYGILSLLDSYRQLCSVLGRKTSPSRRGDLRISFLPVKCDQTFAGIFIFFGPFVVKQFLNS